jgi:hypothetical protein
VVSVEQQYQQVVVVESVLEEPLVAVLSLEVPSLEVPSLEVPMVEEVTQTQPVEEEEEVVLQEVMVMQEEVALKAWVVVLQLAFEVVEQALVEGVNPFLQLQVMVSHQEVVEASLVDQLT